MSQPVFGEIGGVQKRAQINYESDGRTPDAQYLQAISRIGVDVLYVLTGERSAAGALTPDERQMLDLFRAAPLAVKAAAMGALQGGTAPIGKGTRNTSQRRIQDEGDQSIGVQKTKISVRKNLGQVVEGGLVNSGEINLGANLGKK